MTSLLLEGRVLIATRNGSENRILIIDDNEAIHKDFRGVLLSEQESDPTLIEDQFRETSPTKTMLPEFTTCIISGYWVKVIGKS